MIDDDAGARALVAASLESKGYEACWRLRQGPKTGTIPVVMLTASDDPHLNREAYAAGAQACVPKPFRKDSLIAVIEAALAGRPRENPRAGR